MASKATHKGHCQICGALQMLPGGRLAKHGYTTRWGFFEGVCTGSGELPYEQSIGLILDAAQRAREAAQALSAEAFRVRNETGARTWVQAYWAATGRDRQVRRPWVQVDVLVEHRTATYGDETSEWDVFSYEVEERQTDGKMLRRTKRFPGGYDMTLAQVVARGNAARADAIEQDALRRLEYAEWQQMRMAGWQPSELMAR